MTVVSIEVGHVRLTPGPVYNNLSMQRSIELGRALGDALATAGMTVQFAVLADDKHLPVRRRRDGGLVLVGAVEQQLPVAYWFPEHKLKEYRQELVDLLPTAGLRRRVSEAFEARLAEQGSLLCSTDIGIWHAVRLGVIPDSKRLAVRADSDFTPTDVVVSILPEDDTEPEGVARDRYVKYFPNDAQSRVFRLYYPTDPEKPNAPTDRVSELVRDIANTITTKAIS